MRPAAVRLWTTLFVVGFLLVPAFQMIGAPPAASRFGLRDPREGFSGELSSRQRRQMDDGMAALRKNDLERARTRFHAGGASAVDPLPFQLGEIYVSILSGRLEEAAAGLDLLLAKRPGYLPALEARADLFAAAGKPREALDAYLSLLVSLPGDERAGRRRDELRHELFEKQRADAQKALAAHNLDAARRSALALVALDPGSAAGYQLLSQAAEAGGNSEDAYVWAARARSVDPNDSEWASTVAELAMKTARFADAIAIYDELAAEDPLYSELAEEARLQFKIQNLPERVRHAAVSARLTRSQAAVLLWWLVADVRDAAVPNLPEVAVDVVDRSERPELVRSIGLGFLGVSRESHRASPDAPLSRTEFGVLLRKLGSFVAQGKPLPACLRPEAVLPAALVECGILSDGSSRSVGGKEGVEAIERVARLGREGGSR